MSRRPPVHTFVGGDPTDLVCQRCGWHRTHLVHAVPPAAKKPQLRHFDLGNHVVILPEALTRDIRGATGKVVEEDLVNGQQISVLIELDEPVKKIASAWVPIAHVRRMVVPPTFSSIEEAEAWMAAQGE